MFRAIACYLRHFLFDETDRLLLGALSSLEDETVNNHWESNILPQTKLAQFKKEQDYLRDLEMLEHTVCQINFCIHKTLAHIVLNVQISETCVERAFSRHGLVHKILRASLSAETLDDQLHVTYNFKAILKIAKDFDIANDTEVLPFEADDH